MVQAAGLVAAPEEDDDIALKPEDVARMLKISRRQVQLLASRDEIPHRKIGKLYRFSRDRVREWLNGEKPATSTSVSVPPSGNTGSLTSTAQEYADLLARGKGLLPKPS